MALSGAFAFGSEVVGSMAGFATAIVTAGATAEGASCLCGVAANRALRTGKRDRKWPASLYLTLSLAVTFPFNLTIGIPFYIALAGWLS